MKYKQKRELIASEAVEAKSSPKALISMMHSLQRAAIRRKIIVEESDKENIQEHYRVEDEGDDFAPAPQRSPRRQTRRKTTDIPPTPRTVARARRARTGDSVEPSQIFDPEDSIPPEPVSPTKKSSPRRMRTASLPVTT
jgi:structural maintenance of chromosome 4